MAQVFMQVHLPKGEATIEHAADELKVDVADIDAEFGLVLIDRPNDLYAVMVDSGIADEVVTGGEVRGPFANPAIGSFDLEF